MVEMKGNKNALEYDFVSCLLIKKNCLCLIYRRYPLMASAADDGTVHVFHAMTYSDLTRNALIVPLKVLRGHGVKGDLGVMDIKFHPKQPWIFSSGSDGLINLYQDI